MKPLKNYPTELLQSGVFKDLDPMAAPLWIDSENVYPTDRGIAPIPGAELLHVIPETITGLNQASVNGLSRAYIGGLTKGWMYQSGALSEIANSLISNNRNRIETWGSWALFNNGQERPRLWKNTGIALAMGSTPFTWAKHIKRFKTHMLAANTSTDPNNLEWCSSDDIEDWDSTNPENTAGNLTIRDLDGPILGTFSLGQNISLYANETLVTVSYLGNAFVLGAIPTVRGIGVWGGEAVCDLGGFNFGFGPQGLFRTDGSTFNLIGTDRVHKYVDETIDEDRREETNVWHNEHLKLIEFCFFDQNGDHVRLGYDYLRNGFWPFNKKLQRAIERQMFAFAIGGIDDQLVCVNKGNTWNGEAIAGYIQSKPDDLGSEDRAKTVNHLRLNGTKTGLSVKVEALETPTSVGYTALDAAAAFDNWFNAEALYFKTRLYFSTTLTPFEIVSADFNGTVTGRIG